MSTLGNILICYNQRRSNGVDITVFNVTPINNTTITSRSPKMSSTMCIEVKKAESKDYTTVQNLSRFYAYELSAYIDEFRTPDNGLFQFVDLKKYFEEDANRHPFLIFVNGELAGFALIKVGSVPIDWTIRQFFVVTKFQNRGVGTFVAQKLFQMFPGRWELWFSPTNTRAYHFWSKVLAQFTHGNFTFVKKHLDEPWNEDRLIFSFSSEKSK